MSDLDKNHESAVQVKSVTYTYRNQNKPALQDVSLEVEPGTLNIIVGPSGSGKSTLCDFFNGVIPHLAEGSFLGDVLIYGVNTREIEVKNLSQQVGRVFQNPETMFATLYVEDEIAFGPENLCLDPLVIKQDVERLLIESNLVLQRSNLIWQLSGGQVQRLGLATVLAMHPQVVILDEPTSNLDPAATHDIHRQMLALRDEGITVIVVTKELDEFLAQADQLLALDTGRVIAAGPPRAVLQDYGEYLMNDLGVWLPETTEIGIKLKSLGYLQDHPVPITLDETMEALIASGLVPAGRAGRALSVPSNEPPPPGQVLVSGRDLRYSYPGGFEALSGVSLDLRAGEMLAIVGRNGAGKSTLARLFLGLLELQRGELTLFGRPAKRWKVQDLSNHIALVFQNPEHQFLTDSVSDEIGYSLLAQGISEPAEMKRHTAETLQLLDLQDVAGSHPFALSAGKKRRLGVATMLVGEPQILLVDEPTYGQDKHMTATLMALMEQIRQRGIGLVMITHDMRLVQEYAERVVVMSEGEVLYDGASRHLFAQGDLLIQANLRPTILHQLLDRLGQHGITVNGTVRNSTQLAEALLQGRLQEN